MVATSLPLSNPSGTVRATPCRPSIATRSMFGVAAASIGVLPPSSFRGSSAAPSGMMMAYFMPPAMYSPGRQDSRVTPGGRGRESGPHELVVDELVRIGAQAQVAAEGVVHDDGHTDDQADEHRQEHDQDAV